MTNHKSNGYQPTEGAKGNPPKISPAHKTEEKRKLTLSEMIYGKLAMDGIHVGCGIDEMATMIACGIYQSSEAMKQVDELVELSYKDGEKRNAMQYVAIMAVETAHCIKEYSAHWDDKE